jgi:putative ABC transport system permease protein
MRDRRRPRGELLYQLLLRLFPRDFRDRFGVPLLDLFRDKHRAAADVGRGALITFWVRVTTDAFVSALSERLTRRPALHVEEGLMEGWLQDIRYAARVMVRRPVVSIVIIGTLALGIGANTAIFSLVNTALLRGLPYPHADRLVTIREQRLDREPGDRPVPPGNFFDWKARSSSFEDIGWSRDAVFNVTGDGPPETLIGYRFSFNMLQVLGMTPALGRGFTADDDTPGAPKVVILSHGLWQRRYGGDRNIIGRALTLNGESNAVIGVMPVEFKHPAGTEIWEPMALPPAALTRRDLTILRLVGRLKPGVTREQAETELNGIYRDIAIRYPEEAAGVTVHLTELGDAGDAKPLLAVLFGGVGFVLLIACANVANLLLADAASRRRELAVRSTLGASRYRVVRQVLTESVLMALIGGGIGMLVTWWTRDGLLVLFPTTISNLNLPRVEQIDVSAAVFGFAFAVSVVTGLLFGLLPAWNVSRIDLNGALREGDRAVSGSRRMHAALVVAEVALSIVLLAGALLMVQSFARLQQQRFGFDADRVLSARLSLPRYRYPDEGKRMTFTRSLIDRLQAIPGVERVGVTNYLPLSGWWDLVEFSIQGTSPPPRGSEMSADFRVASEDYFRAMGITLIRGRTFTAHDVADAPRVIVVNQSLVNRFMGGQQVVGRRLQMDLDGKGPKPHEIVGVIGDVKSFGLDEPTHAELFFPYWQVSSSLLGVTLRTRGDPAALAAPLRDAVWSVDRDQPITHLMPMSHLAEESLTFRRAGMTLVGGFGLLALVLAAIGIFGVLSYSVTRRTREIGLRLALGATRGDVSRLVIREGLAMAAIGVAIGLPTALVLSQFLRSVLYGVRPSDPVTYLAAMATLIAVAFLATWLPARRASAVDPITALRIE